jgi:hypothetical protein
VECIAYIFTVTRIGEHFVFLRIVLLVLVTATSHPHDGGDTSVFPVRYELGFYVPEDDILHCHSRENLESYTIPCKLGFAQLPEKFPTFSRIREWTMS